MSLPSDISSVKIVKDALGESKSTVTTVCTSPYINKWSRWKPVIHSKEKDMTEADFQSVEWGLSIPSFTIPKDMFLKKFTNSADTMWAYLKPKVNVDRMRLGDFRNYDPAAEDWFKFTWGDPNVYESTGLSVRLPALSRVFDFNIFKPHAWDSYLNFGFLLAKYPSTNLSTVFYAYTGGNGMFISQITSPVNIKIPVHAFLDGTGTYFVMPCLLGIESEIMAGNSYRADHMPTGNWYPFDGKGLVVEVREVPTPDPGPDPDPPPPPIEGDVILLIGSSAQIGTSSDLTRVTGFNIWICNKSDMKWESTEVSLRASTNAEQTAWQEFPFTIDDLFPKGEERTYDFDPAYQFSGAQSTVYAKILAHNATVGGDWWYPEDKSWIKIGVVNRVPGGGTGGYVQLEPPAYTLDAEGGSFRCRVWSNVDWTCEVTEIGNDDYVTVTPNSGKADAHTWLTIEVGRNRVAQECYSYIAFKDANQRVMDTLKITQLEPAVDPGPIIPPIDPEPVDSECILLIGSSSQMDAPTGKTRVKSFSVWVRNDSDIKWETGEITLRCSESPENTSFVEFTIYIDGIFGKGDEMTYDFEPDYLFSGVQSNVYAKLYAVNEVAGMDYKYPDNKEWVKIGRVIKPF